MASNAFFPRYPLVSDIHLKPHSSLAPSRRIHGSEDKLSVPRGFDAYLIPQTRKTRFRQMVEFGPNDVERVFQLSSPLLVHNAFPFQIPHGRDHYVPMTVSYQLERVLNACMSISSSLWSWYLARLSLVIQLEISETRYILFHVAVLCPAYWFQCGSQWL